MPAAASSTERGSSRTRHSERPAITKRVSRPEVLLRSTGGAPRGVPTLGCGGCCARGVCGAEGVRVCARGEEGACVCVCGPKGVDADEERSRRGAGRECGCGEFAERVWRCSGGGEVRAGRWLARSSEAGLPADEEWSVARVRSTRRSCSGEGGSAVCERWPAACINSCCCVWCSSNCNWSRSGTGGGRLLRLAVLPTGVVDSEESGVLSEEEDGERRAVGVDGVCREASVIEPVPGAADNERAVAPAPPRPMRRPM
mmetsp:Transcript_6755/g.20546  ORF Transcript_6755/g.20546 Transcript_6755/m.20546 type:complete len:257 (-) Transcript_6755:157-927(-)